MGARRHGRRPLSAPAATRLPRARRAVRTAHGSDAVDRVWTGRVVALSPPSCGRYRWRGGRFDAWSPGRRLALLASAALFALLAFACSLPEPGGVRVVVDAADGNRWYAEGPAVDDGRLCAEGLHQATGHEDLLSGEALMPAQVEYRN